MDLRDVRGRSVADHAVDGIAIVDLDRVVVAPVDVRVALRDDAVPAAQRIQSNPGLHRAGREVQQRRRAHCDPVVDPIEGERARGLPRGRPGRSRDRAREPVARRVARGRPARIVEVVCGPKPRRHRLRHGKADLEVIRIRVARGVHASHEVGVARPVGEARDRRRVRRAARRRERIRQRPVGHARGRAVPAGRVLVRRQAQRGLRRPRGQRPAGLSARSDRRGCIRPGRRRWRWRRSPPVCSCRSDLRARKRAVVDPELVDPTGKPFAFQT